MTFEQGEKLMIKMNVTWNTLAEMCANSLNKGSMVFVQGKLANRQYETQDGQKRRVSEVVADLVAQNYETAEPRQAPAQKADAAKAFGGKEVFPPEEEIPF